jgi:hypothetical protein
MSSFRLVRGMLIASASKHHAAAFSVVRERDPHRLTVCAARR